MAGALTSTILATKTKERFNKESFVTLAPNTPGRVTGMGDA
jgi:hypothetical protein